MDLIVKQLINNNFEAFLNYPEVQQADIFQFIERHGLTSYFSYLIKENNYPLEKLPKFHYSKLLNRNKILNLKKEYQLVEFSKHLNKHSITPLLLKGSQLAFFEYKTTAFRNMCDIDIIIDEAELNEVIDHASQIGYAYTKTDLENLKVHHHEISLHKKGFSSIDLHWNLFNKTLRSKENTELYDWLVQQNKIAEVSGAKVKILFPDALLIELALHFGICDFGHVSLKNLLDIKLVVEKYKDVLDWEQIISKINLCEFSRNIKLIYWLTDYFLELDITEGIKNLLFEDIPSEIKNASVQRILFYKTGIDKTEASVFQSENVIKKIKLVLKKTFPSKSRMIYRYRIEPGEMLIKYYFKRPFELYSMYKNISSKSKIEDKDLKDKMLSEVYLRKWLRQD